MSEQKTRMSLHRPDPSSSPEVCSSREVESGSVRGGFLVRVKRWSPKKQSRDRSDASLVKSEKRLGWRKGTRELDSGSSCSTISGLRQLFFKVQKSKRCFYG